MSKEEIKSYVFKIYNEYEVIVREKSTNIFYRVKTVNLEKEKPIFLGERITGLRYDNLVYDNDYLDLEQVKEFKLEQIEFFEFNDFLEEKLKGVENE